jgi:hypothetical protein
MIVTNYAVKFRNAAFVLLAVLAVFGSVAYRVLPREGAPDITIPYVFVTALYEGTAPPPRKAWPAWRRSSNPARIWTWRSSA